MIEINSIHAYVLALLIVGVIAFLHLRKSAGPIPVISKVKPVGDDFEWEKAEPVKVRPFVGKKDFRPNMGIRNLCQTPEEWLLIENTYDRVTDKKEEITTKDSQKTISIHDSPRSNLAAREYYDLVTNFMVMRYPQYFIRKGNQIYNKIKDVYIPGSLKGVDPRELYMIIARTIEEDVVVFLKDDPKDKEQEYTLRSSITGFPAGFDPSKNVNKVISEIHEVVPQYKERLKLSMGRFFNRLEPTDLWVRYNWSIQTHDQHFSLDLNHGRAGEKVKQLTIDEIDFDNKCFLRCERQVLTRLPKLRANIMTVRTYLTPIKKVKEEGLAEDLCHAIDALPEDLSHYKKRPAWGEAVKEYLRL